MRVTSPHARHPLPPRGVVKHRKGATRATTTLKAEPNAERAVRAIHSSIDAARNRVDGPARPTTPPFLSPAGRDSDSGRTLRRARRGLRPGACVNADRVRRSERPLDLWPTGRRPDRRGQDRTRPPLRLFRVRFPAVGSRSHVRRSPTTSDGAYYGLRALPPGTSLALSLWSITISASLPPSSSGPLGRTQRLCPPGRTRRRSSSLPVVERHAVRLPGRPGRCD